MVRLRSKIRGVAVFAVFGTGVVGAMVGGCGDDTGVTTPEDAQPDTTQQDAAQTDAFLPDAGQETSIQDATMDAAHPDASPDVAQPDASPDVVQDVARPDAIPDAPPDVQPQDARSDVSDAGSADATDADADSPSEAAPPVDAGDAGDAGEAGCTTAIGALNDSGASQLLFGFDTAAEINSWTSFTFPQSSSTNVLSQSPTDNAPGGCPGALSLALTYTAYGVNSGADRFPGSPLDWTGRVRLRFLGQARYIGLHHDQWRSGVRAVEYHPEAIQLIPQRSGARRRWVGSVGGGSHGGG